MARMDGEEEEMMVIGSGISGSFEPRAKPRLPMRLPQLDYKYPKASAQNFSPGTSLIFNAYRGHGGLLTQPYMAAIENGAAHDDEAYQGTRRSISHEAHAEQQQQLTYQPHENNSYSSSPYRHQKSLEHPSYRTPHEHSFHSYQANGQPDARDYRDYHESRESRDPREYENPGPRYALTRVNYRMIFEYASEIRECLIKGKVGTTDRLLYNAEILSKVFMGCRSDIDPNAPPEEDAQTINPHQLRCTSCYIVKTPEWRKGPLVWGKMSRSKAATKNKLESAPKTDSSEVTNDTQMADEGGPGVSQTLNPPSSMDGSRKRGRDTSMADEDDVESSAREEDRNVMDQSDERLTMRAMDYQRDPSQSTSQMNPETRTSGDTREQDHAAVGEVDSDQHSIARCEEEAPTSLTAMDEGESRKLSLSYTNNEINGNRGFDTEIRHANNCKTR
ncbi:hypothetical protein BGX34_008055 [Mortierella sp. NVP85]|nr:hypothetical protein BGX34_008055 [Mortierella sp. NVP85]